MWRNSTSERIGFELWLSELPPGVDDERIVTTVFEQETEWTDLEKMLERHSLIFSRKENRKLVANPVFDTNGPEPGASKGNLST